MAGLRRRRRLYRSSTPRRNPPAPCLGHSPRALPASRRSAGPGPSPGRGRREAARLGRATNRPASPCYLVRRRCPEPLEESLDLRLARLRRHDLSFPDTTAATGASRAQSAPGPGRSYGCRLSPRRRAEGSPRRSAPTCPVAMTARARGRSTIHCLSRRGRESPPSPGSGGAFRVRAPPRRPALGPPAPPPLLRPRRLSGFTAPSSASRFPSLNVNGDVSPPEPPVSSG